MPYTLTEEKNGVSIRATGTSLAEMFMDGARALFFIMSDDEHLHCTERIKIVVDAKDIPSLFKEWLTELIGRSEQYGLLFGECSIASIQKVNDSQYLLTGAAYGEPLHSATDKKKNVVKGVKDPQFAEEEGGNTACCTIMR